MEYSLKPFWFHPQAGTLPLGCPEAPSIPALGLSWVPGSILEHILAMTMDPWVEQPPSPWISPKSPSLLAPAATLSARGALG